MAAGPILIFDKSALQALSLDEAVLLDNFFLTNITPLFYVETLADLEKTDSKGRSPEDVVAGLASKTPVFHPYPNMFHRTLVIGDLFGNHIEMSRRVMVDRGVPKRAADGSVGVYLKDSPEAETLEGWRRREFAEVERKYARGWRSFLSGIDFGSRIAWAQRIVPPEKRIANLEDARTFAEAFVRRADREVVAFAIQFMSVPTEHWAAIDERYRAAGQPPFNQFAPYAAFVLKIDLVFYLGMGIGQISAARPSNMVDVSYLYYLPFCMVFTSGDNLHARLAPMFMELGQKFVSAADLKAGLKQLNDHYAQHRAEIQRVGLMSFATHPPLELETVISTLWDQCLLPGWRQRDKEPASSPRKPSDDELMQRMKLIDSEEHLPDEELTGEPDFVVMQTRVPVQRGSWRLVPEGVENRESNEGGTTDPK